MNVTYKIGNYSTVMNETTSNKSKFPVNFSLEDLDYQCQYFDISKRAMLLLTKPHQTIALVLGFIGIVINILCLVAIHFQMHGRLTTHFRFIVSLALSDILIAISVVSHLVNAVLNPTLPPGIGPSSLRLRSSCVFIFIKASNTMALNITLLNLMGMALDHFIAIILPLQCHRIMSKTKSTVLIISFWTLAILCGFSDFLSVIPEREYLGKYNFCELTYLTPYHDEYTVFAIAFLCFICMGVIYVRIYIKIHERQKTARNCHEDHRTHNSESMKQTRKALVTTLIILGTFVICWLPMCLFEIILIIQVQVDPDVLQKWIPILEEANNYLYDLLLLNSILDPLIYALRMPEVRCGYRKMGWRLARCCRGRRHLQTPQSSTYLSLVDKKSSFKGGERKGSERKQVAHSDLDRKKSNSTRSK